MPLYALFRAYWAFLGLPRPLRASLDPFRAYPPPTHPLKETHSAQKSLEELGVPLPHTLTEKIR